MSKPHGTEYVPETGDLIWIDFTPQAGHEQGGRRPALVLSPALYNGKTGLAVMCPITSQAKGYPFEVALPAGLKIRGAVLSDHMKNLDWRARRAEKAGVAPAALMTAVRSRIAALLGIA
ncbi:MAG TPA: endoribonuclease MazF [Acidobacteriaceae bacterium]|nr:endoribonuclease MazF [Acidobacteriaceae bacterium]